MKRRFTILTAAFALLTILAFPMGMWGQSDYSSDYTGNVTLSTEGGENASECEIIISNTEYNGIKAGTSKNNGAVMITVPSGTKYLHIHAAAWNNTTCSLAVTPTGYSNPIALTANSGISNNSPFTFNGDANTSDYYKVITFSSALTSATNLTFTATGGKRFVIWGVTSEGEGDTPTCATPIFSPAAGTYTEAQNVTISCETENATIYYTTDGSTPDNTSTEYTGAISVAETTTIKAIAYVGESASNVASATYTILTPMTIAEVREQGTGAVYTSGTVTSCVGTTGYIQDATAAICVFGTSLTIGDNISVQGSLTTYNGLLEITNPVVTVISSGNTVEPEVMTIAEINASTNQGWYVRIENATVTNIDGDNTTISQEGNSILVYKITGVELEVNDIVSLNGNIGNHNGIQIANPKDVTVQQSEEPAIIVDPATVDVDAEEHEGLLEVSFINFSPETENCDIQYYDAEGVELEDDPDWILTEIGSDPETGDFAITYVIDANEGEARTAYFKLYAMDDGANLVYSNLVTINQAAYVAPIADGKYVKVSSTADLTSGQYLIVYEEDGLAFDGSLETLDAVGNTITVAINNNEIAVTEATSASEFTINTTEGTSTIKSASGYYIGRTASSNGMNSSASEAYTNTISLIEGNAVITSSGGPTLRYNDTSNQNRFRYYASGQKAIQLYKKVEDTPTENYTLEIEGYGSSAGGYYLIASPVASVTPSAENGFLTDAYDLYEFDQSADNEWVNYEQHGFDLVSGKGYLYASQANTTLTFEGQPYNGNGKIDLVYDENANLKGWNLIGNPFGVTATVDHDYYVINDTGEGEDFIITSKETPVAAMQGLFVVTEGTDDNKAIFTTEEPETPGEKLVLNVSRNRGIVDRAMIRFGEGHQMPKAMLNENHTKLYIPQANNEYAVVRSDNESEMPINFKAAANGTYTISIDADNVEMDYLHLFDNMTGNDVDLLATPSYTFEANTTDYANRFKLVYKNTTSIEENGETFAYFNGENMIITNEGNAQLQVIDMTSRIVSNETINGNATVKVNAAPGVYMLRLVNGNDIKTQKVIIK